MPLSVNRESQTADRLRTAICEALCAYAEVCVGTKRLWVHRQRNEKNCSKLHGKAKQRIASRRSKEFRRLIEEVL
jgi:hypothetical protein